MKHQLANIIGPKIREIRLKNNETQAQFAKKLKISQSMIAALEQGKHVTLDIVENICDIYSVSISGLLGIDLEKENDKLKEEIDFLKQIIKDYQKR